MSHPLPAKPVTTPTQTPAPAPVRVAPTPVPTLIPSALTASAALLVSAVPIPQTAAVVCRCWTGHDDGIETARRHIFDVAAGAPDVASALAAVVKPDVELTLWAFAVVAADAAAPRLSALDFSTLGLRETTPALCRFDLSHLHPCSAQCATAAIPCADCTKPRPPTICPLARTALKSSRPVRQPLRHLYQLWISALRALVLERLTHLHLLPTPHGVLLNPPQTPTGEWGRPWSEQRSLTHAHIHISLSHPLPRPSSPSHILIHLVPHPTHLYALPSNTLVPGTPLRLLPTFSPAYALAPFTGPTPYGFLQSLGGRGVPAAASASPCLLLWLPLPPATGTNAASPPGLPTPSATTPAATGSATAGSRGMYIVWPRTLCVVDSKMSAIDVSKLPNLPPTLPVQTGAGTAWAKPRRFGAKKAKLSKPITLAQVPPQPSASTSAPQPELASLADTAANLIDAVVRAREKEKEKQRARMERARSGSAVPIPGPGVLGGGVATGPSTPVEAAHPPAVQTQTPTSGLYPSPLANTPLLYVGSAANAAATAAPTVPTGATTSPSSDDAFALGMDLFGDQEFPDQDSVFGQTTYPDNTAFPDGPFNFGYDAAPPASGDADPLDLWNAPTIQEEQKNGTDDMDGELRDEDFNFFGGDWNAGPSVPPVPEVAALPSVMQVEPPNPPTPTLLPSIPSTLKADMEIDPPNPPTPKIFSSPFPSSTSTPLPIVQDKPYFPLTPPSEPGEGRPFDALRFTDKFECVDQKYRGREAKFGIRGGSTRTRAVTVIASGTEPQTRMIAGRVRSLSGANTLTGAPAKRLEPGFAPPPGTQLQPTNRQLQPLTQNPTLRPRPFPQLQLSHLPQFQFKNQLPTPQQSPNALRRLRTGYVGMTNPSAKRIRTLKLAYAKPSENVVVSVFARDWITVEAKKPASRPHSPTATLSSDASDSDSDGSEMDFLAGTVPGTAAPSRGTTPPTSAHPNRSSLPGPALLAALFRPSMLGSGALGDVLSWTDGKDAKPAAPGPVSVPTPVSPGDVHEASKEAIEASANVLAREAVDNWVWGMNLCQVEPIQALLQTQPSRNELMLLGDCLSSIAPGMLMTIAKLTAVPKLEVGHEILTDRPYMQLPRLEKLRQPKISIGHSGQVVQMSTPALRFWETMGLEPVGGKKDVDAYAVFEEGEEGGIVERWLQRIGQVYEGRRLGKHTIGEIGGGLVPVRWEGMLKTLVSLISALPQSSPHIVLYLILPERALSTPAFQSFLPNLKSNAFASALVEHRERLSVHLVPASLLFEHTTGPPESRQHLEHTTLAVYDRIPRTVARRVRREILKLPSPAETIIHVPAFTLARPLAPRFRFSMGWPDGQREVMDRHMFLHVAYGFSKSRQWLGATCVDERGEAYETSIWRASEEHARDGEEAKEEMSAAKIVAKVWAFAMRFAKRAAIEWRIVFCRIGVMDPEELEAWETHTSSNMKDPRMGMHVSVLSFDHTSGLALSTCSSPSFKAAIAPPGLPSSSVIDLTANDYLVLPGFDTEICTVPDLESTTDLPSGVLPLATAHYFRLTDPATTRPMGKALETLQKPDDPPVTVLSSQLHLLHVALTRNSSLWKSGGDPWRELLQSFYALSFLTQARLPSLDPLPVHLAMLTVIVGVADNRALVPVDFPAEPSS